MLTSGHFCHKLLPRYQVEKQNFLSFCWVISVFHVFLNYSGGLSNVTTTSTTYSGFHVRFTLSIVFQVEPPCMGRPPCRLSQCAQRTRAGTSARSWCWSNSSTPSTTAAGCTSQLTVSLWSSHAQCVCVCVCLISIFYSNMNSLQCFDTT